MDGTEVQTRDFFVFVYRSLLSAVHSTVQQPLTLYLSVEQRKLTITKPITFNPFKTSQCYLIHSPAISN